MSDFQRVKDKATGHEYSARRPDLTKVEILDKPATDRYGAPLAPEPKTSVANQAPAKKTNPNGGEPAKNPEEGSK